MSFDEMHALALLAEVDGEVLGRRDGMGVWDTDGFGIRASADAQVLVIEVPMR